MSKELNIAKTGALLIIVTIASKIAAFLVTIVFSYYFGTDKVTDAYYAAGTVPNLVNNSLTICALTLFVPVYIKCKKEEGKEKADEFTSNILNAFIIFNIVLFVTVSFSSPLLSKIVAPGFSEEGISHTRLMICLLSTSFPFTIAVYTLNNLYNANQKYILPAVLTLFNHVCVIVLIVIFAPVFGIYSYPFICTGVWIIQLIILFFSARNRVFVYSFVVYVKDKYFIYMIKQSIPVMLTTAADQINLAADNVIGSDLPEGSISCIGYAHRIFNSLNGLVTATLLTIYYPILSKQYAEKKLNGMVRSVGNYLELMLLLTLPITLLFLGMSDYIIYLLFDRGAMKNDDIMKIVRLSIVYIAGLLFVSLKEFSTRLFYIIGDTKQPTIINSICVAMNICLSVFFKQFWGIYGIAIATTVSTLLCAILECLFLIKKVVKEGESFSIKMVKMKNIIQIVVSCIAAFVVMLCVRMIMSINSNLLCIIILTAVFVASFFLVLWFFKNEYINKLKHFFKK